MFSRIPQRNHMGLMFPLFVKFLITDSISLVDIGLLRLSLSTCVGFSRCVFEEIDLFCLSYNFCEHRVFQNILYYRLNVCKFRNDGLFFISDISDLCFFSLFFGLSEKIIDFIHLLTEQVFDIISFLYCFLVFNYIDLCAPFYYFTYLVYVYTSIFLVAGASLDYCFYIFLF